MGSAPKKKPQLPCTAVRFKPQDQELLDKLHKKLGVLNTSEILRQALRALAAKEGVAA